jgi:hypothetical protein
MRFQDHDFFAFIIDHFSIDIAGHHLAAEHPDPTDLRAAGLAFGQFNSSSASRDGQIHQAFPDLVFLGERELNCPAGRELHENAGRGKPNRRYVGGIDQNLNPAIQLGFEKHLFLPFGPGEWSATSLKPPGPFYYLAALSAARGRDGPRP